MASDVVIVGGGSAGAVLAARLSEEADCQVTLLEAGPDSAGVDEVTVPAAFSTLFKTAWDWNYETTPQSELEGRSAYWPRMKALGGCSAMNAMIYIRGNAADYDTWEERYGAHGWSYREMLPYFIKSEDNVRGANEFHGAGGPLRVEDRRYSHTTVKAFVEAAVAAGFPRNKDHNGVQQHGAGLFQVTMNKGRRQSVRESFLKPAMKRPNLKIITEAHVLKVNIAGGRVTGVTYFHDGQTRTLNASEVILAAGAIGSPHLLMLSGVGDGAQLRSLGIDVNLDNPAVGANLSDHPVAPLVWFTKNTDAVTDYVSPTRLMQAKLLGRGPLTSNVGEGGLFFNTSFATDELPDIQVHCAGAMFYDNGMHEPSARAFTAGPTLVEVRSRGSVSLRTADPMARPIIDAGYFTDPTDMDALIEGCLTTRELVEGSAIMRKYIAGHFIGSDAVDKDDMRAHIRRWGQTLYHPVGTCSIGTVVDPSLRVKGIDGLRVIDASVMPTVPRGNTNAPTIAIAEKGADLVKSGI